MATEDSSATFKDVLLELMVANETLDKIEVGINTTLPALLSSPGGPASAQSIGAAAAGVPAQSVGKAAAEQGESTTGDSLLECCQKILECCTNSYHGLGLLAEEAIFSGGVLVQIRNALFGMRDLAELERLRNLEKDREAKSATRTGLAGARGGNPRVPVAASTGDSGISGKIGTAAAVLGTGVASVSFIPAAIEAFLKQVRAEINASLSPKTLERLRESLKSLTPERIGKGLNGLIEGLTESFERLASKSKAMYRLKLEPLVESVGKALGESYAKLPESFRNFVSEFGKEFSKGLKEMGTELRAMSRDLGLEKMFMSITDLFKDVGKTMLEGAAETRAGLSDGFGAIRKNLRSLWEGLTDIGKTMGEGVTEIRAGLREGWGNLSAKMADLWKMLKESQLGKFVAEIGESFSKIGEAFSDIFKTFKSAGQGESFFAKAVRSVTDLMEFVFNMGSKFGALGKAVGELLGKLAIPITIVLGIKDAITGWMHTEGDWTKKLQGSMTELIDGLIGWAVDLPKMLISWVAGKLGFKEFEKELDKMNFKETILKPFVEWAQNLFKDFFTWMGIGTPAAKGIERNPVKAEKKRDPKILDNGVNVIVNPEISRGKKDQITEMLKVEYGFTKEEIDAAVQAKVSSRIVNPQSDLATAKKTGAEMSAYQKETSDLTAGTTATVVVAPGGGGANVNTANVNNVTVNNSNLPDRTQSHMVPAFGF